MPGLLVQLGAVPPGDGEESAQVARNDFFTVSEPGSEPRFVSQSSARARKRSMVSPSHWLAAQTVDQTDGHRGWPPSTAFSQCSAKATNCARGANASSLAFHKICH